MVYCAKCGTLNPDDAANCSNCGASLKASPPQDTWETRRYYRHHYRRGSIWGIVIGLIIIIIGVSTLLGIDFWSWLWPSFLILVGLAIIFGAVSRGRW
jgi:uncharacterized membrane protein YvbJ